MKPDEAKWIAESRPCKTCGHLQAHHNGHCCTFCMVPECSCEWVWDMDAEPEGKSPGGTIYKTEER